MSATNSICDADLIKGLERIALEAGRIILDVYEGNSLEVERKDDDSPVTIADQRAEAYILKELAKLAPSSGMMVKVIAPPEREMSAWIGCSVMASLSTFSRSWISRQEYEADGAAAVVQRKIA